jgi:hypothetical protein
MRFTAKSKTELPHTPFTVLFTVGSETFGAVWDEEKNELAAWAGSVIDARYMASILNDTLDSVIQERDDARAACDKLLTERDEWRKRAHRLARYIRAKLST